MKANFNSPLPRTNGGERVNACGPLIWTGPGSQPPAGTRCTVRATITQSVAGGTVIGTGVWNTDYNNGDPTWTGTVRVTTPENGHFVPGNAYAEGVLTVTSASPPVEDPWSQAVTLF
jgi:hypothetical protein